VLKTPRQVFPFLISESLSAAQEKVLFSLHIGAWEVPKTIIHRKAEVPEKRGFSSYCLGEKLSEEEAPRPDRERAESCARKLFSVRRPL
jgi:hypothetical protein